MTLGDKPLTLGSLYLWEVVLTKDGRPWDLTGLAVTLWWRRPDGTKFSRPADAAGAGGLATYADVATQLDVAGRGWTFSAQVQGFGFTRAVHFEVEDSP